MKKEDEMVEWSTRHSRSRTREIGDVGPEKEEKKKRKRMETCFCAIFELLTNVENYDVTSFHFFFSCFQCC